MAHSQWRWCNLQIFLPTNIPVGRVLARPKNLPIYEIIFLEYPVETITQKCKNCTFQNRATSQCRNPRLAKTLPVGALLPSTDQPAAMTVATMTVGAHRRTRGRCRRGRSSGPSSAPPPPRSTCTTARCSAGPPRWTSAGSRGRARSTPYTTRAVAILHRVKSTGGFSRSWGPLHQR